MMKGKFYLQLTLLAGMLATALPAAAHQMAHDAHTSDEGFWHNILHSIQGCVTQFTPGYLLALFLLLTALAFVAYRVKRA